MSTLVRMVDPGAAVVVVVEEDGKVWLGPDFRPGTAESVEVARGGSALIAAVDGKVRVYGTELEDMHAYDPADDLGWRLRFGPPVSVEINGEVITREQAVGFLREGEQLPIDFDHAGKLPAVWAGRLYEWLREREAGNIDLVTH